MTTSEDTRAAGAEAARAGQRRSTNPHPADSEAWSLWMDGFETVHRARETGSGKP